MTRTKRTTVATTMKTMMTMTTWKRGTTLTSTMMTIIPPSAKVFVHLTMKFICSLSGARVIKFLSLLLDVTFICSNHCLHKLRY